jgi:hypothetical protein
MFQTAALARETHTNKGSIFRQKFTSRNKKQVELDGPNVGISPDLTKSINTKSNDKIWYKKY